MVEYQEMKDNSDWYYANLDALLPKYNGQYVAIADKSVFGAFAECIDGVRALEKAGKQKGTFIVRRCVPLEEEKREWYYRTGRIRRICEMRYVGNPRGVFCHSCFCKGVWRCLLTDVGDLNTPLLFCRAGVVVVERLCEVHRGRHRRLGGGEVKFVV